jgi:hypothetical protein
MSSKTSRKFISVYFKDGLSDNRKKRDLTISFNEDDPLYEKCKGFTSDEIKKIIGIKTFKDLVEKASKENRTLGNYIKHKLKQKITQSL